MCSALRSLSSHRSSTDTRKTREASIQKLRELLDQYLQPPVNPDGSFNPLSRLKLKLASRVEVRLEEVTVSLDSAWKMLRGPQPSALEDLIDMVSDLRHRFVGVYVRACADAVCCVFLVGVEQ